MSIGITTARTWQDATSHATYSVDINMQAEWPYRAEPFTLPTDVRHALQEWLDQAGRTEEQPK